MPVKQGGDDQEGRQPVVILALFPQVQHFRQQKYTRQIGSRSCDVGISNMWNTCRARVRLREGDRSMIGRYQQTRTRRPWSEDRTQLGPMGIRVATGPRAQGRSMKDRGQALGSCPHAIDLSEATERDFLRKKKGKHHVSQSWKKIARYFGG